MQPSSHRLCMNTWTLSSHWKEKDSPTWWRQETKWISLSYSQTHQNPSNERLINQQIRKSNNYFTTDTQIISVTCTIILPSPFTLHNAPSISYYMLREESSWFTWMSREWHNKGGRVSPLAVFLRADPGCKVSSQSLDSKMLHLGPNEHAALAICTTCPPLNPVLRAGGYL